MTDITQQIAQVSDFIAEKRRELTEAQGLLAQLESLRRGQELAAQAHGFPGERVGLVMEPSYAPSMGAYGFPSSRSDVRHDDSVPTVLEGAFVTSRPVTKVQVPGKKDTARTHRGPQRVSLLG